MEFCPNCGSILTTKTSESGKHVTLLVVCEKCGYKNRQAKESKMDLKIIEHNPKQMVAAIDKKQDLSVEPTTTVECPNCANNTAYVWQVQTRGTDESSTQFLRCTRCGYTFREST